MKIRIQISIIAFLILLNLLLHAQDRSIYFENLREEAGLSYHLVYAVDQDTLGRLWIATFNGLYRYDGYEFKVYQQEPMDSNTIGSNLCRSVLVDQKQGVWVGTNEGGLSQLDPSTGNVKRFAFPQNSPRTIRYLAEDGHGNIWVATNIGLFKVEHGEQLIAFKDLPKGLNPKRISALFVDPNQQLWIGTNKGLFCYAIDSQKWRRQEGHFNLLIGKISDITLDSEAQVWVGVRDSIGLYYFAKDALSPTPYPIGPDFSTTDRVHLSFDFDAHLWVVAGRAGVFRHDFSSGINRSFEGKDYEQQPGNFSNFTRQPLTDSFGNVWFCGGGLHKWTYTNKHFIHYQHPFSDYQSTAAIFDDALVRLSALWARGLVLWDKRNDTFKAFKEENGLLSNNIYALEAINENQYVIGGKGGIQLLDAKTGALQAPLPLAGTIHYMDFIKDTLWLAGSRGIWQWTADEGIKKRLNGINARHFKRDQKGMFWLATLSKGLARWNPAIGNLTYFQTDPGNANTLRSNRIEHLDIDSKGKLWLATGAGLESYEPAEGRWRYYTNDKTIAGIRANAVHVIGDSLLILSNNQGLSLLEINELEWKHFNANDGLLNTYYYERVSYENEAGQVFFGGRKGIVYFQPQALGQNPMAPKLYFEKIKVDEKLLTIRGISKTELEVPWNYSSVAVDFTAVQLTGPESISYRYRLLPVQKEWTVIPRQTLFFNGMESGQYVLELMAETKDGVQTKQPLQLELKIASPLWERWWFWAILFLFFGFGIMLWVNFREQAIRKEISMERRLNELERAALRAQMNPHFIFNAMSSIQHFILTRDEAKALKYLSKLSQLIRKVLEYSSQAFIPLEEELTLIANYIELEQLRFGEPIQKQILIADEIILEHTLIPPMILQPLIENAIIHGLRPSKEALKSIELDFRCLDSNRMQIQITDNGIGRKAAASLKGTTHQSSGTLNVHNRLELVGEQLAINTNLVIHDLVDSQGVANGTRVELIIPYQINS